MAIKQVIDDSKARLDALLTYANGVTGASDVSIGDAVKTLADGYGSGGGDTMRESLDGTLTEYASDVSIVSGQYALAYRKNLVSVSLPNVTSLPGYTFIGCTKLETIDMQALKIIGTNEFRNTAIRQFVSGPSFNSRIDVSCFEGCGSLTLCDFAHITTSGISRTAFYGSALDTLIIRNTDAVPPITNTTFIKCPIDEGAGRILVPRAMVDSYKSATNWNVYAAQISALEDHTEDGTVTGRFVG